LTAAAASAESADPTELETRLHTEVFVTSLEVGIG
jgi:hypothetical protein